MPEKGGERVFGINVREHAASYVAPALRQLPAAVTLRANTALGRLASPDEIAAAVAFLVSPDTSYMPGATLNVDGGQM